MMVKLRIADIPEAEKKILFRPQIYTNENYMF